MMQWFLRNALPVLIALPLVLWLMREEPPTQVFGIYPLTTWVKRGDDLRLRFVGIRNRACPVLSSEELIDSSGRTFRLPPRLGNPERETGPFDIETTIHIPEEATEGLALFRTVATYGVDPAHGCFQTYIIGPPNRPDARFWIGDGPPPWLTARRPVQSRTYGATPSSKSQ